MTLKNDEGAAGMNLSVGDDRLGDKARVATTFWRGDFAAGLVCALIGLILAVEPHLAMFARYGTPEYIADGDDVFYLAIGRIPYSGESGLRDSFLSYQRAIPTTYSWLQFVPLSMLTRWLDLRPELMPLVWRFLGGPMLGATLYLLFRRLLGGMRQPIAWSLACAVICLADSGLIRRKQPGHARSCLDSPRTFGTDPRRYSFGPLGSQSCVALGIGWSTLPVQSDRSRLDDHRSRCTRAACFERMALRTRP